MQWHREITRLQWRTLIAAQLGARATMAKPFSRQEVLNAIREALAA